jgi:flagellar basal body-associated protein FliL
VTLVAGGVAVLLVAVAVAMPKVFPFGRGERDAPAILPEVPGFADALLVSVAILVLVLAVVLRVSVVALIDPTQVRKRKPVLLQILMVVTVLWVVAFAVAQLAERREETRPPATSEGTPVPAEAVTEAPPETSRALGVMLTIGLGVMILGLAAAIAYFTRSDRGEHDTAGDLAAELRAGIEEIKAAPDARDAVIACYARMEAVLTAAGVTPRSADTPFEFVGRALGELDVPPNSAQRLTELFEWARFSPHGTDASMRSEAVSALEEVRASLEGRVWEDV